MEACVLYAKQNMKIEKRPEPKIGDTDVRVKIIAAGICGSDLHYFKHGQVASFKLRQPLVLGHEASGEVIETGINVSLKPGDKVVINPSLVCQKCKHCLQGKENLCRNIQFMGSASFFPHIQGTFQETVVVKEQQCHLVKSNVPHNVLAFAEPLSVALHTIERAGKFFNQDVLIVGAGAIGLLVGSLAKLCGARSVSITDILDYPLQIAQEIGIDKCVNIRKDIEQISSWENGENHFSVVIEATGSHNGLTTALNCASPGAAVVEVGILPNSNAEIPFSQAFSKEIDLRFVLRQNLQFGMAVDMLENGRVNPLPLLSGSFELKDFQRAFSLAENKAEAIKVQINP